MLYKCFVLAGTLNHHFHAFSTSSPRAQLLQPSLHPRIQRDRWKCLPLDRWTLPICHHDCHHSRMDGAMAWWRHWVDLGQVKVEKRYLGQVKVRARYDEELMRGPGGWYLWWGVNNTRPRVLPPVLPPGPVWPGQVRVHAATFPRDPSTPHLLQICPQSHHKVKDACNQVTTTKQTNVILTLAHCLRRWPNVNHSNAEILVQV